MDVDAVIEATREQQLRHFALPSYELRMPYGLDEDTDIHPYLAGFAELLARKPRLGYLRMAMNLIQREVSEHDGSAYMRGSDIIRIRREVQWCQFPYRQHTDPIDVTQFAACVEDVLRGNLGEQYDQAADLTPDLVIYNDLHPGDE